MSGKVKFTAPVRRGLRQILEMDLAECVEQHIRDRTASYLKRNEKLKGGQVAELRAAIAWIKQEAAAAEGGE